MGCNNSKKKRNEERKRHKQQEKEERKRAVAMAQSENAASPPNSREASIKVQQTPKEKAKTPVSETASSTQSPADSKDDSQESDSHPSVLVDSVGSTAFGVGGLTASHFTTLTVEQLEKFKSQVSNAPVAEKLKAAQVCQVPLSNNNNTSVYSIVDSRFVSDVNSHHYIDHAGLYSEIHSAQCSSVHGPGSIFLQASNISRNDSNSGSVEGPTAPKHGRKSLPLRPLTNAQRSELDRLTVHQKQQNSTLAGILNLNSPKLASNKRNSINDDTSKLK